MHGPYELQTKLAGQRVEEYQRQAEEARLLKVYLQASKARRSWRYRLAEALLGLATRLTPYHRRLIQVGRQSGTIG